jgi:hypothetical protein
MSWLFPQLPRPFAEQLIEGYNGDPSSRVFTRLDHPQRIYQASGGDRLPDSELHQVREEFEGHFFVDGEVEDCLYISV